MSVLVGKKAPLFNAPALINGNDIQGEFSLDQYIGNSYVIFFFYPKDFTFVCPSELHAFQAKLAEFEAKGVKVVACSTDTEESHWGWAQVEKNNGGIKGVKYPIVADTNKTISDAYGVLVAKETQQPACAAARCGVRIGKCPARCREPRAPAPLE